MTQSGHGIPRTIWSIWLSENPVPPPLVRWCLKSHEVPGYEHRLITLDNCYRHQYVQEAIDAKQWGKACDWLRIFYLIQHGGIYLDADVLVLPEKNFDFLLGSKLFAGKENNGFVNTAVLGAEPFNPTLMEHMVNVNSKFTGNDGKFFESSIELITPLLYRDAVVLPPEVFYPYDHQRGTVDVTEETLTYHFFMKSWKEPHAA